MFFFKQNSDKLTSLGFLPFKDEKEVNRLISSNIPELFDAVLVANEFPVKDDKQADKPSGFIDALAYHEKTEDILIIEYKANLPHSSLKNNPIRQVRDYGELFLLSMDEDPAFSRKVEGLIESKIDRRVNIIDCNIRLIALKPFVDGNSPFTDSDIKRVNKAKGGQRVELYGVQRFENDFLFVQQFTGKVTPKTTTKSPPANTPSASPSKTTTSPQPRGQYDEPYFTDRMIPEVRQAYEKYRDAIEAMCQPHDLEIYFNQVYISFKVQGRIFTGIIRTAKQLQFNLNLKAGELSDPQGLAEPKTWHYGSGKYGIDNAERKNFDQVMGLIRQAYDKRVLGA